MLNRLLSRLYGSSKVLRIFYRLFCDLVSIFFIVPLSLASILLGSIKVFRLYDSRIGHLASNTDLFLRKRKLEKRKEICFGFASTNPCNKQLLKVIKRQVIIVQLPEIIYKIFIMGVIDKKSLFGKTTFYMYLPCDFREYKEFNSVKSQVSLIAEEEEKGKELLNEIGVKKDFICFHSRDPSYLDKKYKGKNWSRHDFRDCNIENYLEAANYLGKKGIWSFRMGAIVDKNLPKKRNSKVIDYSKDHRTDFLDIYLPARCKFFLGNSAGLFLISTMFDIPVAHANTVPMRYPPLRKEDIFIPMKIWSTKKKRLLTFKEIVQSEILDYCDSENYKKAGLKAIQNTPEEIKDLAEEMNARIDGTWKETKEDRELQKKFKGLFTKDIFCHGFQSRIGTHFLRKNKDLLSDA